MKKVILMLLVACAASGCHNSTNNSKDRADGIDAFVAGCATPIGAELHIGATESSMILKCDAFKQTEKTDT